MVERESGASRLFNILNYVFLAFIGIICLYPFLYVVFASFSDPNQFIKHDFTVLWAPAGFSLEAYKHVFTGELGSGYMNTLIYVVAPAGSRSPAARCTNHSRSPLPCYAAAGRFMRLLQRFHNGAEGIAALFKVFEEIKR